MSNIWLIRDKWTRKSAITSFNIIVYYTYLIELYRKRKCCIKTVCHSAIRTKRSAANHSNLSSWSLRLTQSKQRFAWIKTNTAEDYLVSEYHSRVWNTLNCSLNVPDVLHIAFCFCLLCFLIKIIINMIIIL